jgi:hypothetical protein
VAVDSATNLYVADSGNHSIRKVTPALFVSTPVGWSGHPGSADGPEINARFNNPSGVAVDGATSIYVADTWNHTIRKLSPTRVVTTIAGQAGSSGSADGIGKAARFSNPNGVAVDGAGNVYVADFYFNTIRKGYPPPMFRNSEIIAGQFFSVLSGPPGQLVIVEASTDLLSWLLIWTNTFAGDLNFSDPQSNVSSSRFYRTHLP